MALADRLRASPRHITTAAIALAGLFLTGVLYRDMIAAETDRHTARVERLADRVVLIVRRERDLAVALHDSIAGTMAAATAVTAKDFNMLVNRLNPFELVPSIRGITFAPRLQAGEIAAFSKTLAADPTRAELAYPPFLAESDDLRGFLAPAIFVEPRQPGSRLPNFDVLGTPERRAAAERSIATGKPQATAPLVLAQDSDTQVPGVIIFAAVAPQSMPAGFLTMGLKIERLIGPALQVVSGPDTRIEVIDIGTPAEPNPPTILLSLGTEAALGPEGVVATRTAEFAGRLWRLRLSAAKLPVEASATAPWLAVLGCVVSALAAFAAWTLIGERDTMHRAISARTIELIEANGALRAKAAALERANEVKAEFLGRLGHELRTPLNAVIGFAEMLSLGIGGALAPRQKQYVDDIHASGAHLLELVNRLLDIVRIERGEIMLSEVPFNAAAELGVAVAMARASASASTSSVRLVVENEPNLPRALGDPLAFRQVAVNLIENAIKFSVSDSVVRVRLQSFADRIVLTVDDRGVGIPGDQLARIFEPFHQVETGDTRRFGGAGLGLAIVDGLVQQMRGRVAVTSQPGEGTKFRIEIPAASAASDDAVPTKAKA